MSSANSFSLLEDTTSSDTVEIAKKRAQQKQVEAAKIAQQKKVDAAAKVATAEEEKKGAKAKKVVEAKESATVDNAGFEQKKQVRNTGKGPHKKHVAPKTGRQFDRHSGTGRGKEVKKQGGGAHNWGKLPGKDGEKSIYKVSKTEEEPTTPVTPATEEKPTEETAAPATTEVKPEEEVDNTLTYDQLLEQKKKAKAAIKVQSRKANEAAVDPSLLKASKVVKEEAVDAVIKVQGVDIKLKKAAKVNKKPQQKKGKTITEFFAGDKAALESLEQAHQWKGDNIPRAPRTFNGPKGAPRTGGNPKAPRKNAPRSSKPAPTFNKEADFPELK